MIGTVKLWSHDFGFIIPDCQPNPDVFVHHSALGVTCYEPGEVRGWRTLYPGERVEFDVIPDKRRQQRNMFEAIDVQVLEPSPERRTTARPQTAVRPAVSNVMADALRKAHQ